MDTSGRFKIIQPIGDCRIYAISNKLKKEPAFAWWVPHVIKKCNNIFYAVASRVWIKNMKYSMIIPTSITQAYDIDKENGNTVWIEAIK